MRILAVLTVLSISTAALAAPREKAFEYWPPRNGAKPVPYEKKAPAFEATGKPWKFEAGPKVKLKVDTSKTLKPITPYHFGNNASWWSHTSWFMSEDILEKARQSGIRFWRWPGGSSSDSYHWDGKYDGHKKESSGGDATRMTEPWAVSTDDFIEFCRRTGSEAIFTANYGAARYFNVNYAADMASRWVKYVNHEKKFKVRHWEVGNENYGNWEEGTKMPGKALLSGDVYGKDFRVIADAMKKADPDIYIGAVAVDQDNGEEWTGFFWWMKGLLPELKGKADYLILHQYFMWPFQGDVFTNPGPKVLFGNLPKLAEAHEADVKMVAKYAPSEKGIPIALTEFNIFNSSGTATIELINGLYTTEVIGEGIRAGYVASNYWDWRNGLDGKMKGDMGMLSTGDPAIPDGTPRPSYYAYALATRAFGDKLVAVDCSEPGMRVYASTFSSGEVGLVVVNENPAARTLALDVPGSKPGRAMGWVLTGKGLNDKRVSWNGEWGPAGGGGPFPLNCISPYQTAFVAGKPVELNVPAFSATGVILYGPAVKPVPTPDPEKGKRGEKADEIPDPD